MKKNKNIKENKKLIVLIIVSLILDQVTKIISYKQKINLVPSELAMENNGYYIIISIIIVLMIIRYISNENTYIKKGTKIILSLAVAGAIGNVIDRIWNGYVIVFINLGKDFYINFAYIYIIIAWVGMAAILAKNSYLFLKERKNKKVIRDEHKKDKSK